VVRRIQLEEQFYLAFRTTLQILLKDYDNRGILKEIMGIIYSQVYENSPKKRKIIEQWMYKTKLSHIENILRELAKKHIEFVISGKEIDFMAFEKVMICRPNDRKKYCIMKNGIQRILIPKMHLYPNPDGQYTNNEKLYYRRFADELLRYKRIQFFILEPNINVPNTNYKVDDNELLVLNSQLTQEYFATLIPYKQMNITYDTGNPYQTHSYANRIPYIEQTKLAVATKDVVHQEIECIKTIQELPGNASNIWKRMFPTNTQEYIYHNTPACTFYVIIDIIENITPEKNVNIKYLKNVLLDTYRPFFENEINMTKVLALWSKQGKKIMVDKIRTNSATLEEIILSEGYYLTNLDIWILADRLNLPIVFFSTLKLKDLEFEDWSVHWLFLSDIKKNFKMPYFFIKPPVRKTQNHIPEYGVITKPLLLSQIKGMENMVKSGLMNKDYSKNLTKLDDYMTKFSTIIVAPKKIEEL
jgi:hypothetical protein